MKVLLMGMGLQGKAVAHHLEKSSLVKEILVLDNNLYSVNNYIAEKGFQKITARALNAECESEIQKSVSQSGADLVITMLPVDFGLCVARAALDAGIHFVSASYTGKVARMDREAKEKGVGSRIGQWSPFDSGSAAPGGIIRDSQKNFHQNIPNMASSGD